MPIQSLSSFLNYGGLGVLALVCVVVLGYGFQNLSNLIRNATVDRITAAKPLLQTQLIISFLGLVVVGGAASFLAVRDQDAKNVLPVHLAIYPWETQLDAKFRPLVTVDGALLNPPQPEPIVKCYPGRESDWRIDLQPYVDYRIQTGLHNSAVLARPTL